MVVDGILRYAIRNGVEVAAAEIVSRDATSFVEHASTSCSSPITMVGGSRVFEKKRDDTQNSSTRIFDLPTLTIDQLLTAFQEMDLKVTEQDLLHPTAEHTEQIFVNILYQLKPSIYEAIESTVLPLDEFDFEPVSRSILVYSRMYVCASTTCSIYSAHFPLSIGDPY